MSDVDDRPFALDLCSGAGGMTIGLEAAGWQTIGFDLWQPAIDTHRANGLECHLLDLMAVDDAFWLNFRGWVDLIAGGPPCQPFSSAGLGRGEWDPRDAIPGFIRAVRLVQPRRFVMENVRGLTFKKHAAYLDAVLDAFREAGYVITFAVLNAEEYGVPQTRQRLFIVGSNDGTTPELPAPTHRRYRKRTPQAEGDQSLLPWVSMAEALGWGMTRRPSFTVLSGGADTGGAEPIAPSSRAAMTELAESFGDEWWTRRPSTTVVGSFRPDIIAAPGYRVKGDPPRQNTPGSVRVTAEEGATLQAFPMVRTNNGNPADGYYERSTSDPAPTVTGEGVRSWNLTPAESAILQAFPNGFTFTGNKGTVFKQIGNAVPPPLAYAVAVANAAHVLAEAGA